MAFEGKNIIYNQALIKKLDTELSLIIHGQKAENENKKATIELLKLIKPNYWNLNMMQNAEKELELTFEEFMLSVKEHTTEDLNNITTFRFYSLLKYIKKKNNTNYGR